MINEPRANIHLVCLLYVRVYAYLEQMYNYTSLQNSLNITILNAKQVLQ